MHRPGSAAALVLFAALAATTAHADIPPRRLSPALRLAMVSASAAPDAPAEDVRRAEREVRAHLARSSSRIRQCLDRADLRRDPLRSSAQRMELRLRFGRSGRPERVWVHQNERMPAPARRCVLEAARGIAMRPAPRGRVLVRVVYELR